MNLLPIFLIISSLAVFALGQSNYTDDHNDDSDAGFFFFENYFRSESTRNYRDSDWTTLRQAAFVRMNSAVSQCNGDYDGMPPMMLFEYRVEPEAPPLFIRNIEYPQNETCGVAPPVEPPFYPILVGDDDVNNANDDNHNVSRRLSAIPSLASIANPIRPATVAPSNTREYMFLYMGVSTNVSVAECVVETLCAEGDAGFNNALGEHTVSKLLPYNSTNYMWELIRLYPLILRETMPPKTINVKQTVAAVADFEICSADPACMSTFKTVFVYTVQAVMSSFNITVFPDDVNIISVTADNGRRRLTATSSNVVVEYTVTSYDSGISPRQMIGAIKDPHSNFGSIMNYLAMQMNFPTLLSAVVGDITATDPSKKKGGPTEDPQLMYLLLLLLLLPFIAFILYSYCCKQKPDSKTLHNPKSIVPRSEP